MFIAFAIGLRMIEGVGTSLSFTAMYTLLPELFPNRVSLVMVRIGQSHSILVVASSLGHYVV